MSTVIAWTALGFCVQTVLGYVYPARLGRGLITRLWRRIPPFGGLPAFVRLKQILFLMAVFVPLSFSVWDEAMIFYWLCLIVLYLDDYFFGDDDNWRRKWDTVRNKIRWKMKLPQPQSQGSGTA